MRLSSCTFHNFGPFGDFKLDLAGLGDEKKLVALTGLNGSGKTFCLEAAVAGACYRSMPTHGLLGKRATARDSWLETELHYRQPLRIKQLVDAVTGKGEALVTDSAGQPLLPTTSVAKFDSWAALNLPDQDVLFASLFASQQSEGFVKMGSAERIDVILKVIGVARLERMAKRARAERDKASAALTTLAARIADARGDVPTVEAAQAALATAEQRRADADRLLAKARQGVDSAETEARRVADLAREHATATERLTKLGANLEAARAAEALLAERVKNNQAVLAEGDAIRAARVELEALTVRDLELAAELAAVAKPFDAEAAALDAELASARQAEATAEAASKAADRLLEAAKRALSEAEDRTGRANVRLRPEAAVKAAVEGLDAARAALATARHGAEVTEQELAKARGTTLAGAQGRIERLREGHQNVVEQVNLLDPREVGFISERALDADDEEARLAVAVPATIDAVTEALAADRSTVVRAESALSALERDAARAQEMVEARAELDAAVVAEAAALSAQTTAAEALRVAADEWSGRTVLRKGVEDRVAAESTRRSNLEGPERAAVEARQKAACLHRAVIEPLAAKHERLVAADARLAELDPQLEAVRAETARLEALHSATPAPTVPPAAPDVAAFQKVADDFEKQAREAHAAVAVATQTLARATSVDAKLGELEADRARTEADLADWTRLSLDLGRSGLQSAEVDSAGPELTELINDLLRSCHGPRYSVSVDTQRPDADGKKMIDECRIQVIDTVAGTEKEVREHSGGERALLGTAISLALTMLACRRAGFERPTIIRDETGANLDSENWPTWVAMLRRAITVTGADKLVIVEHRPEIIEMADAVIEIPNFRKAAAA